MDNSPNVGQNVLALGQIVRYVSGSVMDHSRGCFVMAAHPDTAEAPVPLDGTATDEWLCAEFAGYPHQECPRCFRGPAMHEVEIDRFGDPAPICVTENGDRRW